VDAKLSAEPTIWRRSAQSSGHIRGETSLKFGQAVQSSVMSGRRTAVLETSHTREPIKAIVVTVSRLEISPNVHS
jgi:hypothetical protein